jgi:hypothetical protein
MSPEIVGERIAVLEQRLQTLEDGHEKIMDKLEHIDMNMTKYKGFLGGIAFIASALWAFVQISKEWLVNHIK